jgi:hypothetical protein
MKTELDLIKSARGQYRCAYKQMAREGSHDLFFTQSGVTLDRPFSFPNVAVRDVNCMTEDTMIAKLVVAYRAADQVKLALLSKVNGHSCQNL